MVGAERLELRGERGVLTGAQPHLQQPLCDADVLLGQAGGLGGQRRMIRKLAEGPASPQRERPFQLAAGAGDIAGVGQRPPIARELVEPGEVDLAGGEVEDPALGHRAQPRPRCLGRLEDAAQPRDRRLQQPPGSVRRRLTPDRLHEHVRARRAAQTGHKQREDQALLRWGPHPPLLGRGPDLDRPEHP